MFTDENIILIKLCIWYTLQTYGTFLGAFAVTFSLTLVNFARQFCMARLGKTNIITTVVYTKQHFWYEIKLYEMSRQNILISNTLQIICRTYMLANFPYSGKQNKNVYKKRMARLFQT